MERSNLWAIVCGLVPQPDGDQWCVLWGANLQEGIAAFGKTPHAAIMAFEKAVDEGPEVVGAQAERDVR